MRFLKRLLILLDKIARNIALFFIGFYRYVFSPSDGLLRYLPFYPRPSCIFYPTCSAYARECFVKYPFFIALAKSLHRLQRCHPGNPPSVDLP